MHFIAHGHSKIVSTMHKWTSFSSDCEGVSGGGGEGDRKERERGIEG